MSERRILESPDGDPLKRGEIGDEVPLGLGWLRDDGREATEGRPRKPSRLILARSLPEALRKAGL